MDAFHDEWLGMVRPIDGLVVAKQALIDAQVARPDDPTLRERLEKLVVARLVEPGEGEREILDLWAFFAEILALGPERWRKHDQIADAWTFALPDTGQLLRPTAALVKAGEEKPLALVWDLPAGLPLDEREVVTGPWDYPPSGKFERLLRHTGVPIGLVTNRTHIRMIYAPHGASTGAMTFRVRDLVPAAGRPLLDAFVMLLHSRQWFSVPPDKQLPRLLAASREAQGKVTEQLANQVLEALHILLAGFEAADGGAALQAAYRDPERGGDHVYGGLLVFMLRLVFVLYAEDNGLLPVDHPFYARNLSVLALYDELAADAGAFPDAMSRRYGAYGRLVALFRAIYFGVSHGSLKMPPRHGDLFSPHVYTFLEGVTEPVSPAPHDVDGRREVALPSVDDETVYRVLHRMLVLGEERLSYKALDVEQIGSVYEVLMGFSVEQLAAPAVCLKESRTWLSGEQLAAEPQGGRSKWLQDEIGLAKSDADKIAKAIGGARKADAILHALASFARANAPRAEAGRFVIQPGAERRRSGSHYTPRSLTSPIVEKTLAPLLAAIGEEPTSEQLLSLKICDPAMGSGAFLVEVVRQLGDHVVAAWRREGKGSGLLPAHGPAHASEDAVAIARRLVAQRCVYGVDKNPQAVMLAKMSLWLVTLAKDKPFTFVDHALRHGDSLVGLDLNQIVAFHWEPGPQVDVVETELRQVLDEAVAARERITALANDDSPAAQREKERLLRDADDAVGRLRVIGDLVLGAFFSSNKSKERETERIRRRDLVAVWLASDRDSVPGELLALVDEFRAQLPAFHWMIEVPEVFWAKRKDPLNGNRLDGQAWIDAFVGNPPFLGGRRMQGAVGEGYQLWLQSLHNGSKNADLVAHFLRRCHHLVGDHGAYGLIATNTISQGDTRATGLQCVLKDGGTIYDAIRSMPWPGEAAVSVSVVHIEKGLCSTREKQLDRVRVANINSRLLPGAELPDPIPLKANADLAFQGCVLVGEGFLLTAEERERLVAKSSRNAERIFPYLGGEGINASPTHDEGRYVINLGDASLEEAARFWPDLLAIVREKVKPQRDKVNRNSHRMYWWHFGDKRPALLAALARLDRFLSTSYISKHRAFAWIPSRTVISHNLGAFTFGDDGHFAVMQSRVHIAWAALHSSTLEDRSGYRPSDCFETFPFPSSIALGGLESIGKALYDARARYMVDRQQGLTDTYNALKDVSPADDAIPLVAELRGMHEDLDRAVLSAYGWSDIKVPPYCPKTDADRAHVALFEDLVVDRLFALNAERAAAERGVLVDARETRVPAVKKSRARKQPKDRAARNQTSLLDDD